MAINQAGDVNAVRLVLGLEANDADDRLLNWIWGMATQPCWELSAHLPQGELPFVGAAQLDLAACEFAVQLAEMGEALAPWMNAVSPTLWPSLIEEIDRRVLRPYGAGVALWWQDDPAHTNN